MPAAKRFELVGFEGAAPRGAAACDGLVRGAAIDLSHWAGNATPPALKRDTSVEIALAFARSGERIDLAVNNHFDADGALAVFALVRSEIALAHADLLVAAAEAGDFDEWPSDDRGLRLEAAVRRLATLRSDADAYRRVLAELEAVLVTLDEREDLWGDAWRAIVASREAVARGDVELRSDGASALATLIHPRGAAEPAGPAIHRASPSARHRLFAYERGGGAWDYRLERARHAWADTVARPRFAPAKKNALAQALSAYLEIDAGVWALKDDLGMTGLLRTRAPIAIAPSDVEAAVARALAAEPRAPAT